MSGLCYSLKGEDFCGEADDCVREFIDQSGEEIVTPYELAIYKAECNRPSITRYLALDAMIEGMQDTALEDVGEYSEYWLDKLNPRQKGSLLEVIDAWASANGLQPSFWRVGKSSLVTVIIRNQEGDWHFKNERGES